MSIVLCTCKNPAILRSVSNDTYPGVKLLVDLLATFLNGTILLYLVILLLNYQMLFVQDQAKLPEFGIICHSTYIPACYFIATIIYHANEKCLICIFEIVFCCVGCLLKQVTVHICNIWRSISSSTIWWNTIWCCW